MKKSKRKQSWFKLTLAIPFLIFIFVIAGIHWLCEHSYNFIKGNGWTGMCFR